MNTDEIKKLIEQKAAVDPKLRLLMKQIESGNATFQDTSEYSRIFSEIIGKTLSENVLSLEEREAIAAELLRYGYDNINNILERVQTDIDRKKRVNIRPQKALFPKERVSTFSHSLEDRTVPDETIQRRANNGTANITMSFHDDYMKENAKFRSNAGLRCYIDRQTNGKCCTWCSDIAGRYDYGNEPQDVYRRHDNCDCTVTYENGRQRQDVWSKRSWEVSKNGLKYTKPTVISRSEARRLNEEKQNAIFINNPSIDKRKKSDIIELKEITSLEQAKKRDHKIEITDIAIDKTTHKNIPDLTDEQNQKINLAHRTLLTIAKNDNDSNEVAYLIDLNSDETAKKLGSEHEVNIFENPIAVSMAGHSNSLFLTHNHPSTKDFSYSDLGVFLSNDSFKGISVVSNTGKVHILYKSDRYDFDKAYEAIIDIKSNYKEYNDETDAAIVKDFLKISKSLGIIEY